MSTATTIDDEAGSTSSFPRGWYPDPWRVAPWRWWDGVTWTTGLYGPFGEAWPIASRPRLPSAPKGPGVKGGGIAAVGAGVGVVASLVVTVGYLLIFGSDALSEFHPWYLLVSELPLWLGFVGATIFASRANGTGSLVSDYGLSWPRSRDWWSGVASGVTGRLWPLVIVVLIVIASHEGFGGSNGSVPRILGVTPTGVMGWSIVIFVTVIGAPVIEELFFRGLIQGAFTRRIGTTPAILATAFIFTLVHVVSEGILAPLVLFPMALILGYLRHKTGRLAAGMVAHATFNASLLLLFLVPAFR